MRPQPPSSASTLTTRPSSPGRRRTRVARASSGGARRRRVAARRVILALSLRRLGAEFVRPLFARSAPFAYPVELVAGDRDELVNIGAVLALHCATWHILIQY